MPPVVFDVVRVDQDVVEVCGRVDVENIVEDVIAVILECPGAPCKPKGITKDSNRPNRVKCSQPRRQCHDIKEETTYPIEEILGLYYYTKLGHDWAVTD